MSRRSFGRFDVLGFIANDPVLRRTGAGEPVINLRIIENTAYTPAGGTRVENAHAHNVTFWGKFAEEVIAKLAHRGSYVLVRGDIRYKDIEGQEFAKETDLRGDEFFLLDDPRERGTAPANNDTPAAHADA